MAAAMCIIREIGHRCLSTFHLVVFD